jgi:hypothetical protein
MPLVPGVYFRRTEADTCSSPLSSLDRNSPIVRKISMDRLILDLTSAPSPQVQASRRWRPGCQQRRNFPRNVPGFRRSARRDERDQGNQEAGQQEILIDEISQMVESRLNVAPPLFAK